MNDDRHKLCKIIAKTFRKAKWWYLGYLVSQAAVLLFGVVSIFAQLNPNLSAMIAFLGVLSVECIRWRSDCWKTQGESAKRRWEMADALGETLDGKEIADWLAAKPKGFLTDISPNEIQGSEFDSIQPPGPRRAVENTQESAWWSKHQSRRMVNYLGFFLALVIVADFAALSLSIGALKSANVQQSGATAQNVGGVLCSVLIFVFSVNLVRLLTDFWAFGSEADRILSRCSQLLKSATTTDRDALSVMHDYQTARNSAPLIPTFIWKIHGSHLREQWKDFRPNEKPS